MLINVKNNEYQLIISMIKGSRISLSSMIIALDDDKDDEDDDEPFKWVGLEFKMIVIIERQKKRLKKR